MPSLIAAYSVAWGICVLYVVSLQARQRRLEAELAALRETIARGAERNGAHRE